MLEIAVLIWVSVWSWLLGFCIHDLVDRMLKLKQQLAQNKQQEQSEIKSSIVEPLTPEQQAVKDMEERVRRLNQ